MTTNNKPDVTDLIYKSVNCQSPASITLLNNKDYRVLTGFTEILGETELLLLGSLSNDQTRSHLSVSGGELLYER